MSGHRVSAAIIPASWSDDQGKRLARVINRILSGGGLYLYGVECCVQALDFECDAARRAAPSDAKTDVIEKT